MKPCPSDHGEIGNPQRFSTRSTMATVTPHTEMINDLLKLAVESGVSDVIIKANKPGYVRLAGKLKPVDMDPITSPEADAFVSEHVPKVSGRGGKTKARWTSRMQQRASADS